METHVNFSLNFAPLFSVTKDNSSVLFSQILFTFVPKISLKCKFLWLLSTRGKMQKSSCDIWTSSVPPTITLCCFHYMLWWKSALKCKFLRFSSWMSKIRQTPHVTFDLTSQFPFKSFIILQCHHAWLLCNF